MSCFDRRGELSCRGWGGTGRGRGLESGWAGWGGFTSATGVVAAACTSWSTLLSHSGVEESRNQKRPRSLSEGVTGQQGNGHDESERREDITGKELELNTELRRAEKPFYKLVETILQQPDPFLSSLGPSYLNTVTIRLSLVIISPPRQHAPHNR